MAKFLDLSICTFVHWMIQPLDVASIPFRTESFRSLRSCTGRSRSAEMIRPGRGPVLLGGTLG